MCKGSIPRFVGFIVVGVLLGMSRDDPEVSLSFQEVCTPLMEAINTGELAAFKPIASEVFLAASSEESFRRDCRKIVEEFGRLIKPTKVHIVVGSLCKLRVLTEQGEMTLWLDFDDVGQVRHFELARIRKEPPIPVTCLTPLHLPFKGVWHVENGMTRETNYHYDSHPSGKYAVDFSREPDKNAPGREKQEIQLSEGLGEEILAAACGEVVVVVNGMPDCPLGERDQSNSLGNRVVIKHSENEFSLYAHLQQSTIPVRVGQRVATGQVIGHCGNSGYAWLPHLHFQMQNSEDLSIAKGIPFEFRDVMTSNQKKETLFDLYRITQGDLIKSRSKFVGGPVTER